MNELREIFGSYRVYSAPLKADGYETLIEGMEENVYAVQYQRVILESKDVRISFGLKFLFDKEGYDAFGPDAFFFHSHQFVDEKDDTETNNMIAEAFTNYRLDAKMY
ncbi:TPA: hypothetical protein VDT37_001793 [Pseudomonas aeruginosa]|nr:hypothetical protein [Pseudomonas aeruginosa]